MKAEKKNTFPPLTENEGKLVEAVTKGNLTQVQALLQEKDVKVDCLDESGMTPLQHAAFRGQRDIAEYFLRFGADVNANSHENGYTTLMFAALSEHSNVSLAQYQIETGMTESTVVTVFIDGNAEMTRLVLQHGARKDRVNSVGRNAAQMAAFVGQHHCVAVINNFFDKAELEYYTVPRGQEKEPKLPPLLVPPVLALLNSSNMHPVKISQYVQSHPELLTESYKVCKVLDLICEKSMKARDTDDVMAMKTHYMATLIRKAKDCANIETWIKALLKGRENDGYPEFQDRLIRQSLKEFPYVESQLLQNMVRQLSTTKIGDHPTSLNILNQGINGQKFGFDKEEECSTCGELGAEKKCSACKMAHYCNQKCQKLHWFTHKKFCKQLAEQYQLQEAAREKAEKEAAEREATEQQKQQITTTETKQTDQQEKPVESKDPGQDSTGAGDSTDPTRVEDSTTGDTSVSQTGTEE